MSKGPDTLLAEALALDERDRAALAAALLNSLGDHDDLDQEAYEAEWSEELRRRAEDLRGGRVQAVPWRQVREELRDVIRQRGA